MALSIATCAGAVGLSRLLLPAASPARAPLVASAQVPSVEDYYLGYSRGGVDHFALYYNFGGTIDHARKADVLFLGNSKTKHTFRRETLEPFFAGLGLRYFNLGFGYGDSSALPSAIIERYDLRPRWVIVNADPFFMTDPSAFSAKVMKLGEWNALKFRFETEVSFRARRQLHAVVPYFGADPIDWIEYRSLRDGTMRLAGYSGTVEPLEAPDGEATELPPYVAQAATAFKRLLDARGAKLILTFIPPASPQGVSRASAEAIARLVDAPLIVPAVSGLKTIDKVHLDAESADRFSKAFLEAIEGRLRDAR